MRYLPLFIEQGRIFSIYGDEGFDTFEGAAANVAEWVGMGLTPYGIKPISETDINGGIQGRAHLSTGEVITIIAYTGAELEKWISRN